MNGEQVSVKTPEFVSLKFKLAGLGSRSGAILIDEALLLLFNILVILVLNLSMQTTIQFGQASYLFAIVIIALFIVRWGYFFVTEYFFGGRTLGKKMIGIRVIQDNGHSITLLSSAIRNLLRIVDMLPAGYFIGILMVFFHPKHKRLGDLISGTVVIHEREVKKKENPIEKKIESRGLTKESLTVDSAALTSLGMKEWKLLKTYSERIIKMDALESTHLTQKVASILLPKLNLSPDNKTTLDLENTLLLLYLILKEEWEYEL